MLHFACLLGTRNNISDSVENARSPFDLLARVPNGDIQTVADLGGGPETDRPRPLAHRHGVGG